MNNEMPRNYNSMNRTTLKETNKQIEAKYIHCHRNIHFTISSIGDVHMKQTVQNFKC